MDPMTSHEVAAASTPAAHQTPAVAHSGLKSVSVRSEMQQNPVAGEVAALVAVVRPILNGLLSSLKEQVQRDAGGRDRILLRSLPRLYRPGDGDCGICFEYAIHDAVQSGDPTVLERVTDALRKCKVPGVETRSILFGVEKNGAAQLIATAHTMLTDDSRILTGRRSQPPKLKSYLNMLSAAFRRPSTRVSLPTSINGLWKTDLFLGTADGDRWVGTTVKINPAHLEAANGLRVGIVPAKQGRSDRLRLDEHRKLLICPIPYDQAFMEVFYSGWGIVQQFIHADAQMPKEVALPVPAHRQVARELVQRRDFPVVDVVDVLRPLAQPELLRSTASTQAIAPTRDEQTILEGLISPVPLSAMHR